MKYITYFYRYCIRQSKIINKHDMNIFVLILPHIVTVWLKTHSRLSVSRYLLQKPRSCNEQHLCLNMKELIVCVGDQHQNIGTGPNLPTSFPPIMASYQIRKIAGCACAGNAGNIFPATDLKGNR